MKRILQIAATSIALLLVFAVAAPALAATSCPTADTAPIDSCLAKYKLTASDIDSIMEKLSQYGLTKEVLRYGPVCETGGCTTPDCTKIDCDGTECVTTDCAGSVCGNTGSASDEQLNSCTEADCADNGCDAADCATAICKDTCADTRCIPAEEEPADTAEEAAASEDTEDNSEVKAVAADTQEDDGAIEAAIAQAEEAVKNDASSSNCPQTDGSDEKAAVVTVPQGSGSNCPTGGSDVKSQLQDAVNNALNQAKSQTSSGSNCPTSGSSDTRTQIQDAVNNALEQAKSQTSSGSSCPAGSGSADVGGLLNQLQNSGLSNCNR
ncbi:MAG TPA: hypothetical protein VN366_12860 [Feifaniaceae bacterium]|nr:hypothetical protein [Feifaniaceae bacterium]